MEKVNSKPISANILVADDDEDIISLLDMALHEQKFKVTKVDNGLDAIKKIKGEKFDLFILDYNMPKKNGIEVCKIIKENSDTKNIPVIIITAVDDPKIMLSCFDAGADEFLKKPFTVVEILARVTAMLRIKLLHDELTNMNQILAKKVEEKSNELHNIYIKSIRSLATLVDQKDTYSTEHSRRVAKIVSLIAKKMNLSETEINFIKQAAEIHDIGKIGIHDSILRKKTKLTSDEIEEIKKHSELGARILKPLENIDSIIKIIEEHHERYDGYGYPGGIKGEEITLGARIMAVADAYESMTSDRPYRKAFSKEKAIKELENNAGKQFDPEIVKIFVSLLKEGDVV